MKASVIALVVATLTPFRAAAQTRPTPPPLPRFDVTASLGWHSANESLSGSYQSWYGQSLSRSVAAGFYWTEHWKSEVDVGWTGAGELWGEHPDSSTALQTYGSARHSFSTRNIAVAQRYQFGHNAMFHPDLAAGAIVEWVEHSGELEPLFGRNGMPIQPRRPIAPSVDRRYAVFVSSGVKAYLNERMFLRSDVRVGFRREMVSVLFNAGIGMDF
jgi:hypothetical protein